MDSLFCAVQIPDHGDSSRHEEISGLFQEFLCPALSQDLASGLFSAAFHVCYCPVPASIGSPNRVCIAVVPMVGLSIIFLQNFLVPVPISATGLSGVTWSPAVEEQFYLIWPLVVRFCNEAQLRKIAIAVICISPALRFYLSLHQVNIYSNTFYRLDGLMAGAFWRLCPSTSFLPSMCREPGSPCLSRSLALI